MLHSLPELVTSLNQMQKTMIAQLQQWCEINSGTTNLSGLQIMMQTLQSSFTPLADELSIYDFDPINTLNMAGETIMQECGSALFIRKRPQLTRRILLCGHMDTVYAPDHPFQHLSFVKERLIGPGVTDMKGGLVVMLHALNAFEKTPFAKKMGWDVFINADEEIGSPASSPLLEEMAQEYQAALIYEPAMDQQGTLAKNRKGSGKFTVIAIGKEAHAGRAFHEGRNAICHLADAILAINDLNGYREGVTINVGRITGGEALNIVPGKAAAKLDIRISEPDDEFWLQSEFENILHMMKQKGYEITIQGEFRRPVKRINKATQCLFTRIKNIGNQLGLTIDWVDSGGCCDGNNLAQQGLPVIDSLGVCGGAIHSPEEYILLNSLVERATLSALVLTDLAQGGLEDLNK